MSPAPGVGHLHTYTPHIRQYMLCILLIKQVSHYLQLSQGTYQGNSRGLVGDYPKISAPGVRLLQPLCDKSPPFPRWGGVGLCIDRCIREGEYTTSLWYCVTTLSRVHDLWSDIYTCLRYHSLLFVGMLARLYDIYNTTTVTTACIRCIGTNCWKPLSL